MRIIAPLVCLLATLLVPTLSFAAGTEFTGNPVADDILGTLIYSVIGIIMAFLSFKVCDLITPGDLSKDIADNNIALGVLTGLTILGICIIIAAAIV